MQRASIFERTIPANACLAFQTVTQEFRSSWHAHAEFEIVHIESGWGTLQYGAAPATYSRGDILVLGPWIPHEFLEKSEDHQSISLLFNRHFITPGFFDSELARDIRTLLDSASAGLIFPAAACDVHTEKFRTVLSEHGLQQALTLLSLLQELTSQRSCGQTINQRINHADCKKHAKLQDILHYIHRNAHRKLLVDEVAGNFYMSRSHFSRFFHQLTGKRFSQYLTSIRIEGACRLLAQSEKPITEIGYEVGFDTISSFNRSFLHLTGQVPRQYRDRLREPAHLVSTEQ